MVRNGKIFKVLSDKPIYLDIAEFNDGEQVESINQDYFNFVEIALANEIKI